ncbi:hypothetical protein NDN08_006826 [Rhodosorus marinus]|uniref:Major facilitator superfamily (MFS) profile domain-containing protein n=1 Tax=Rhodosorus marinus TaxID=101924 RepID=A0AAV8UIT1_9RHOD|nr:hypothetical protein NDN08_006826 [Rhodosorus marinus]
MEKTKSFTIDEAIDGIGFGKFHWMLMFLVGISWIGVGMQMMLLSFLGPFVRCLWTLLPAQVSILIAVESLGIMCGNILWGCVGDRFGRKKAVLFCTTIIALFGVVSAFTQNISQLCAMRFFVGIGSGGIHVAFLLFVEFVPSERRGFWSTVIQGWWIIGTLAQAVIAMLVLPTLGCRAFVLVSAVPIVVFVCLGFLLVESPRFLLSAGQLEKAFDILEYVSEMNGKKLPPGELADMCHADPDEPAEEVKGESCENDKEEGSEDLECIELEVIEADLKQPSERNSKSFLNTFQQLLLGKYAMITGILLILWIVCALLYYGIVLLTTTLLLDINGCDAENPLTMGDYLLVLATTGAEIPGLLLGMVLLDRIGAKPLLALLLLMGAIPCFLLFIPQQTVRVCVLFLARTTVGGAFHVLYTYTPECYGTSIRTTAFGFCTAIARIGAMIAPFVANVPPHYGKSWVSFTILGVAAIVGGLSCFFLPSCLPNRRRLKQLDGTFRILTTTTEGKHGVIDWLGGSAQYRPLSLYIENW